MKFSCRKALAFARLADHAYTPKHFAGMPEGWTHVKSFRNEKTDAQAFIAVDGNRIVVSTKGTKSWKDVLQDAKFELVEVKFGDRKVRMEKGFYEDYEALRDRIVEEVRILASRLKDPKVLVTGHSLGGAIASGLATDLGTRDLRPDVWTFGSPRPGDASFMRLFNEVVGESWRIVHLRDLVPGVPKGFGYQHVDVFHHIDDMGREVPSPRTFWKHLLQFLGILKADLDGEGIKDHFMDNYIRCLERGAEDEVR